MENLQKVDKIHYIVGQLLTRWGESCLIVEVSFADVDSHISRILITYEVKLTGAREMESMMWFRHGQMTKLIGPSEGIVNFNFQDFSIQLTIMTLNQLQLPVETLPFLAEIWSDRSSIFFYRNQLSFTTLASRIFHIFFSRKTNTLSLQSLQRFFKTEVENYGGY